MLLELRGEESLFSGPNYLQTQLLYANTRLVAGLSLFLVLWRNITFPLFRKLFNLSLVESGEGPKDIQAPSTNKVGGHRPPRSPWPPRFRLPCCLGSSLVRGIMLYRLGWLG